MAGRIIALLIIAAMGAGLIFQDRKIHKLRALRRIDRAKFKEALALKGQHDRASLRVSEALRQEIRSKELQLRKEQQMKQCFKRACKKLKSRLDDTTDEVESLRSALDSANGTIRAMMEDRASGGAGLSAATESLSCAARAFRKAAGGADG